MATPQELFDHPGMRAWWNAGGSDHLLLHLAAIEDPLGAGVPKAVLLEMAKKNAASSVQQGFNLGKA